MASIRTRPRADGTTAHTVLWREGPVQRSLTFDNPGAADQARRLLEATGADAEQITALVSATEPGRTLAEAVEVHITELTGIQAQTRATYLRIARDYIYPTLGPLPIQAVDKTAVSAWINHLDQARTKTGDLISDKTIRNVHGLLSAALSTAVDKGWLPGGNPSRGLRLPRRDHGDDEMVFLTTAEWALLCSEIVEHWRPMFIFLAGTGCRWGEAVGVTVGHLDFAAVPPVVRINQADRRTPEGRKIGPTKTRRSRRAVTLPARVVAAVDPLTTGRAARERLFVSPNGLPAHSGLYQRVWQPAIARARDRDRHGDQALTKTPRIHDLRHSHASWLIAAGVDLLAVSRRLGHESITTTSDRYGHLLPDQQRRAAEAADQALGG